MTLAIIALLLYLNFMNLVEVGIVMLSLPFALVGGVWLMWVAGFNFSAAVAVGFIALAGVAAEIGVVMLVYLDRAWDEHLQSGAGAAPETIIERGAVLCVRPILMTVTAIIAGLMPILWSHGTGASVMQRIAAPMIGGMVTATALTLIVIPVLYYWWRRGQTGSSVI